MTHTAYAFTTADDQHFVAYSLGAHHLTYSASFTDSELILRLIADFKIDASSQQDSLGP